MEKGLDGYKMKIKAEVLLYFLIAFFCLARFLYLGAVPGINGDEGLYGIKTAIMAHKPFTLTGFNSYTGPIISYFRIPFYYLTGLNVFSLRFPVVILSLISIFYAYKLLRDAYNARTGIIGALLLSVMPWFFISSRFADETHTTLVFFALGGLYYLTARRKLSNRILAALFLGLGFFNHVIFITIIIPYSIYFLARNKFKLKLDKANILFFVIFSGFLFIRLFLILKASFSGDIYCSAGESFSGGFIANFMSLAPHFLNMLDGSVFYERMTGRVLFFVIPLSSFLFIVSFLFLAARAGFNPKFKDKDRMFIAIFILSYLINAIFLRQFALRYFLITLMFATILIAIFIGTSGIRNLIKIICVFFVIILNCFYLWHNYIRSFKETGGMVHYFSAGNFIENSNGFIDSSVLYDYLKKRGIKYVWIPGSCPRRQLIFFDLKEKRLNIESQIHKFSKDEVYLIGYKGENVLSGLDLPEGHSVHEEENTGLDNYQIFLIKKI